MYATLKKAQPRALKIIENSKLNSRLSHAYLFTGPKGTYKKEMAYHFAMMLYCKDKTPCYECSECKAILENRHLNIHYIEPFGQSIKKEQIIALQEEFSKTSLVPGPRVYIINEADTMSTSAANSLLKFIEEPNGETYGILITEHKDNILSTIISRSVVVAFNELDKQMLNEQLLSLNAEPFITNCLSYLTSNISDAGEMIENEGFVKVTELFKQFIQDFANGTPLTLFYKNNLEVLGVKDFANKTAHFEMDFEDISGEIALNVSDINGQLLSDQTSDYALPLYYFDVNSGKKVKGDKIVIKDFIVEDFIRFDKYREITVTAPDGSVCKTVDGITMSAIIDFDREYEISVDQLGAYKIIGNYGDGYNDDGYFEITINAYDEVAPVITISEENKSPAVYL